jgi:hypothetical protein
LLCHAELFGDLRVEKKQILRRYAPQNDMPLSILQREFFHIDTTFY